MDSMLLDSLKIEILNVFSESELKKFSSFESFIGEIEMIETSNCVVTPDQMSPYLRTVYEQVRQ